MESGCHVNIDQIMNKAPVATELDCAPARLIEDELLKSKSLEEQGKNKKKKLKTITSPVFPQNLLLNWFGIEHYLHEISKK